MSMRVKMKRSKPKFDGPVLMTFPQGPPAQLTNDQADIRFTLWGHKDKGRQYQRVLHANTQTVAFEANNYTVGNSVKSHPASYAVGLFNRKSKQLRLVPVPFMYSMRQQVNGLSNEEQELEQMTQENYGKKRSLLVEQFGSRKRKRVLKAQQANRVDLQHEQTFDALGDAMTGADEGGDAEAEALQRTKAAVLPAHDAAAQHVQQIYPLTSFVTEEEWKQLAIKPTLKLCKKPKQLNQENSFTSGFVLQRLRSVKAQDKKAQKRIVGALLYLDHMVTFKRLPRSKVDLKLREKEDVPVVVQEQLLARFAQKQGKKYTQTGLTTDKLVTHALVLAMVAAGMAQGEDTPQFTLDQADLTALMADLGLTRTKIAQYFREAGCPVTGKQGAQKVTLTAPLKLPGFRKARAKKK